MAGNWRSQQDVVNGALARIGVLVAGQAADPSDFNYVNEEITSIFFKLKSLSICAIPDAQNIPAQWYNDLCDIVAGECATKFGVDNETFVKLKNAGLGGVQGVDVGFGAAAKSLREINRGRPTFEVLQTLYL